MTLVDDALPVLARTPEVLRALLAGVPDAWIGFRAQPGSWSAYDVVGHLIHGDRTDWIPRTRVIVTHGASQPFTPFDREGMRDATDGLDALLDVFASARAQSLADLAELRLGEADLAREGMHPGLGRVTLGQLIASWVVHDLSHVAQIAETMAKRYAEDVGPWRAYLPVLDRAELPD